MKRFVTYLYEYDRTIRGRNVGFIRNDIRNDRCLMDIHIRGLERIKEKAPIYLIVRDGECVGIPAGVSGIACASHLVKVPLSRSLAGCCT